MTGGNRNVNYELGVAHAYKKPSILIASKIEDIPFDYQHLRRIIYDNNNPDWGKILINDIVNTVNAINEIEYNYF